MVGLRPEGHRLTGSGRHPGGWSGPPPSGGWNSPWNGPARDIAIAQSDFGPFNYGGYTAIPVLNPVFRGRAYGFFGTWIPLY